MSAPAHAERFPAGQRIASRYIIESVIGEGASGIVYRASRDDDRKVALKVIHRHLCGNRQIFKRYHREAKILKRLAGPHVVGLLDFIEEDGLLMIALEHVHGGSLDKLLKQRSPLSIDETIGIALQVCSALESAHAAGVVHRDLKPANVLLDPSAPSPADLALVWHIRVADFGLAKVVHGEQMTTGLTEQDMIFGTPEYMAPEQVRGEDVDPRCDVYALGCMLYEMAVGDVPFRKRTAIAVMTAHLTEEPPLPRASKRDGSISASFEAVLLRALAKSPADRHQSARAFADALLACRERRLVARLGNGADGSSITDLELRRSAFTHASTVPAEEPSSRGPARGPDDAALGKTLTAADPAMDKAILEEPTIRTSAPDSRARERVLWIAIAVVCAMLGVAIGTLFGTR